MNVVEVFRAFLLAANLGTSHVFSPFVPDANSNLPALGFLQDEGGEADQENGVILRPSFLIQSFAKTADEVQGIYGKLKTALNGLNNVEIGGGHIYSAWEIQKGKQALVEGAEWFCIESKWIVQFRNDE